MGTEWFWKANDQVHGPFRSSELIDLGRQGKIPRHALVRRGRGGKWNPARTIAGLFETQPEDSMWYVVRNGQMKPIGPLTAKQLKRLAENGGIPRDAFIRNGLQSKWVHVTKVKGVAEFAVNAPHPVTVSLASQANPIPLVSPPTPRKMLMEAFRASPNRRWWHGGVPFVLFVIAVLAWSFWPDDAARIDPATQEKLKLFREEERRQQARTVQTERKQLLATIAQNRAMQEDELLRRKHAEEHSVNGVELLPYESQLETIFKRCLPEVLKEHGDTDVETLRALAATPPGSAVIPVTPVPPVKTAPPVTPDPPEKPEPAAK